MSDMVMESGAEGPDEGTVIGWGEANAYTDQEPDPEFDPPELEWPEAGG